MKKVLLFGYSGHAKVVRSAAESNGSVIAGYFDKAEVNVADLSYFGNEQEVELSKFNDHSFFAAIGSNEIRKKLHDLADQHQLDLVTIIDCSAKVAQDVLIARGTLVAPGAIINPASSIEEGVIINSGAIVEHDCSIGAFSHIAPGAILLGGVTVGEHCFIGAGSIIKEGVRIASNVIIGAGSVVLSSIESAGTWVGSPAKKIR